ncbi:MAG: hypothetical protein H6773_04505 [Pseudomonadales bacterium]|nr:hypothetical protein [Pseudomonadales bacterium]
MLKRALTALLAVAFVFLVGLGTPAVAQAQGGAVSTFSPAYDSELYDAYNEAIQDCGTPSLECLVHHVYKYIVFEMSNSPRTSPPPSAGGSSGPGSSLERVNPVAGGLIYMIGQMYANPPASTGTYVADVLDNAHIATPAYAQGIGFAALDPVLSLWKTFRNMAYLFFVLVFIIIGFLIMFRSKVNGADVTAQQAIPSIIVSLIFVTFSYAIAGFLIDIMYLIMFLMIGIFDTSLADANIIDFNIFQVGGLLFGDIWTWGGFNQNVDLITNMLSSLVGSGNQLTEFVGIVGGATLTLVLTIAVLFGVFKLFFELLKSYANVVVNTVIAPITLMMGAIPGKNALVPWLRNIAGNLSAFPTVLFIIILYNQFTDLGNATNGGFMPPFLLGRGQAGAIASLMGLALILAMPEIVKEVKTAVGATEGFGTKVAGWAADRAKRGTSKLDDVAHVGGTAGAGLAGGAYAYGMARTKGGLKGRAAFDAAISGATITDGKNRKKTYGGATRWGGKTFETIQSIRKQGERISQGRFLDPEDPTKYLAELARKGKNDDATPATPVTPKPQA